MKPKRRQPAPESDPSSGSELSDDNNDEEPSDTDAAIKEAEVAAQVAQRKDALGKARMAQSVLDKALAYQSHNCPSCNSRYCFNKHASKANAKVHASTTFYRRSRDNLVKVYGGSLPEALEAELPEVGRC